MCSWLNHRNQILLVIIFCHLIVLDNQLMLANKFHKVIDFVLLNQNAQ